MASGFMFEMLFLDFSPISVTIMEIIMVIGINITDKTFKMKF